MPFIPHTDDDVRKMLDAIGAPSIEALFDEIPLHLRGNTLAGIPYSTGPYELAPLLRPHTP